MDGQSTPLSGISGDLHTQFVDWLDRRKPQEEEFLRVYQDMMRISRDDDTAQSGMSKAQKSKIFIGSTRGKIRTARAKIKDSLFPANQLPFDVKPTNEDLKEFADTMEEILTFQFEEGGFRKTLGQCVDGIATYGTGFIFGPFNKEKKHASVEREMGPGNRPRLKETVYEYDCPYYEHARVMDCYPDPEAEDEHAGRGIYWASRKQPEFVRALIGKPGYSESAIKRALTEKVTAFTDQGSDRTDAARMNLYRYTREGRIWFTRFFGIVRKSALAQWKADSLNEAARPAEGNDEERIEIVAILAGGQVIKAEENPYKNQKRPVRRCVYEDVEHEMWGVGVGKNNDPHQRVINAAFRLFIEGKAYALLKTLSIDKSKFEPTEDFKLFPGKRFQMRAGLTPEERKSAMIWHDTPDVTPGWESLIALSEKFSDDDTAITKYTQGNDDSHLNKTATGISMIMNASSLPIKEVLSNIDPTIEDMVEDQINWNMEHLEPETVKILLGDKQAQIWAQIKEYGKTNFMEWSATGSATFMAKEVLMHKLQGYLQLVLGNEAAMREVDLNDLLQQVWDAGQIGRQSPVLTEEKKKKQQSGAGNAEAMQHIQEIEAEAKKMIEQALERAKAAEQQAADAKRMESLKRDELAAKSHKDSIDALVRMAEAGPKAHLTEAQIDKLQAETVKTLKEAAIVPTPEMAAAAAEKELSDDTRGTVGGDSAPADGADSSVADATAGTEATV